MSINLKIGRKNNLLLAKLCTFNININIKFTMKIFIEKKKSPQSNFIFRWVEKK